MSTVPMQERDKRAGDHGALCWIAARFGDLWDFIDKRDIDKYIVSAIILLGTVKETEWAMTYASATHDGINGSEVALVIAAVTAPYMALQAAAIKFFFDSRSK